MLYTLYHIPLKINLIILKFNNHSIFSKAIIGSFNLRHNFTVITSCKLTNSIQLIIQIFTTFFGRYIYISTIFYMSIDFQIPAESTIDSVILFYDPFFGICPQTLFITILFDFNTPLSYY